MKSGPTIELTDANFQSEVMESGRPVLVDFWAAWCGPCRLVSPVIDELATEFDATVKVGKLNVDEHAATAAAYRINSIPTVLLFDGGKVVETFVGVQPKERYRQALAQLAA